MSTRTRTALWLAGPLLVGIGLIVPTAAGEHATIHHAGVIRTLDVGAERLVVDERTRVGPSVLTTIRVTTETSVVRIGRDAAGFVAEPSEVRALHVGDYVVIRGVDRGGDHWAEVVWSFGAAE